MSEDTKIYDRTMSGLRDALFDELQDLRAGIANPNEALAFAKLADKIIQTVVLDLRANEMRLRQIENTPLLSAAE